MSQVLDDLLALLKLEEIEQCIYRGQSQDLGFPQLFGGQVMGQSLSAAQETVDSNRYIHSLHSYFLRKGDAKKPVVYDVEKIRDGKSFSTRRVKAIQNGHAIFYMTASFQTAEKGFEHQDVMPNVPSPEILPNVVLSDIKEGSVVETPIEMRTVQQYNWSNPKKMPSLCHMWVKANGCLPEDPRVHTYMLAYTSDFYFLPTALMAHGKSHLQPNIQIATIDHSMWFHRPFRFDDWLLYEMESPSANGGRGLVKGKIFNRAGELVASTVQEGVIRQR